MAAILDFMESSNTKNVCIYIIDQPVKFRGIISQFKILPYSPPIITIIGANIAAAILGFQQKIDQVVHIGCVPIGS